MTERDFTITLAAAARVEAHRLIKLSSASGTEGEHNGAGETAFIGVSLTAADAGEAFGVRLRGPWGTHRVAGAEAIAAGASLYAAAAGKVKDSADGDIIGTALSAIGGDGQLLEAWLDAGTGATAILRANLAIEELKPYAIPLADVRAAGTGGILGNSAGTPSGALGLTPGTFGTNSPLLVGEAANNNSKTNAGRVLATLPPEYVAGGKVRIRVRARITGDVQVAQTVDVVAHQSDGGGGISADLVTTAAQTVTDEFANYDFVVTPTALSPGDVLDVQVVVAANDTGGNANKLIQIGGLWLLADIRG
ncbi:MAG: DUF2190 family protein [Phycisphaerae bacterium]|nr:DUF2190 family protein [Phycisphaerae bacterium]MCZ2398599.1 DUF2190 family protein [Phycisphaerae bacterium]